MRDEKAAGPEWTKRPGNSKSISILPFSLFPIKETPKLTDVWHLVADLCILIRQFETAQTELLVRVSELAERLESIESELWLQRQEAEL